MTQTAHEKYEIDGLVAERRALMATLVAKDAQIGGLLNECEVLRARIAELEEESNAKNG